MRHSIKYSFFSLLVIIIFSSPKAIAAKANKKICLTYEEVDKKGKVLGVFHAINLPNKASAEKHLNKTKLFTNSEILHGSCSSNSKKVTSKCINKKATVCSNLPTPYSSFRNFCRLKAFALKQAGSSKSYKTNWSDSPCPDNHCLFYEKTDNEKGQLFAVNTKSYTEALNILESQGRYINEKITRGSCEEASKAVRCDTNLRPVCSDVPHAFSEKSNICSLKKEVLKQAGKVKRYDGIYTSGRCPVTCDYNGYIYQAGEKFDAGDRCNTCSCESSGKTTCSRKDCQSWNFNYIKKNAQRIKCPKGTTPFRNRFGKGCRQASICPKEIFCTATSRTSGPSYCKLATEMCPFTRLHWGK